jgi:hypothetical protein
MARWGLHIKIHTTPKPPKPRLFKAKSAPNIRPHDETFVSLEKKHHFTGGCAGLIYSLLSVYIHVCAHLSFCTFVCYLNSCTPAFLPSCLSSYLPPILSALLAYCLPACLTDLPSCLIACLTACLLACLKSCRTVQYR